MRALELALGARGSHTQEQNRGIQFVLHSVEVSRRSISANNLAVPRWPFHVDLAICCAAANAGSTTI